MRDKLLKQKTLHTALFRVSIGLDAGAIMLLFAALDLKAYKILLPLGVVIVACAMFMLWLGPPEKS